MAVEEIITVARYNQMQSKVALVLGNGSGQYGYGESLQSVQVSTSDTVNASHMENLKTDLTNTRVHQTGSAPTLSTVTVSEDITDAVYAQYEAAATSTLNNANDVFESTQTSTESKLTSTRTASWGGSGQVQGVEHHFTVTFNDEDHRRHFFNAGGEIRFSASLTGGTGSKYTNWNAMLQALGTVKFSSLSMTADSGTSSGLGNFELTSSWQTLLIKTGSGVYSANDYTIKGRAVTNKIYFQVEFNDDATGSGSGGFENVDDPVTGTLTSTITQLRATGSYVEVATPAYTNTQQLT
jgi:hypothetical protein